MKNFAFIFILFLFFSCEDEINNDEYLIGKWNALEGYSVLFNYENGFELNPGNIYYSRYYNTDQKNYYTNYEFSGNWYFDPGINKIHFLKEYNESRTDTLTFDLKKFSDGEIEIKDVKNSGRIFRLLKEKDNNSSIP